MCLFYHFDPRWPGRQSRLWQRLWCCSVTSCCSTAAVDCQKRAAGSPILGKTSWVMLDEHPLGLFYLVGQKKRLAKSCQLLIFGGSHVSSHLIHRSPKKGFVSPCAGPLWSGYPIIVLSMIVYFMSFSGLSKGDLRYPTRTTEIRTVSRYPRFFCWLYCTLLVYLCTQKKR